MKNIDSDKSNEVSDEALASLLDQVESRQAPPEDVERAIFEQTHREWGALLDSRAKRVRTVRTYRYLAAAAVLLLAILIKPAFFPTSTLDGELQMLGLVNNQSGTAFVVRDNQQLPLSFDSEDSSAVNKLFPGDSIITTPNAGVSIHWGAGSTIRIAASSELTLLGADQLELVTGQVYADIPTLSDGCSASPNLKIETRYGTVQHIGTQFMVSSQPDAVVVKVREGSVSVSSEQHTLITTAGHQSALDSVGEINSTAVPVYGDQWQWAEQLAPAVSIEGEVLHKVLNRIGRETGKQLVYDSADAEQIANTTIMHGSIDGDPNLALESLLQTNELSWYEENGTVHLFVSQ